MLCPLMSFHPSYSGSGVEVPGADIGLGNSVHDELVIDAGITKQRTTNGKNNKNRKIVKIKLNPPQCRGEFVFVDISWTAHRCHISRIASRAVRTEPTDVNSNLFGCVCLALCRNRGFAFVSVDRETECNSSPPQPLSRTFALALRNHRVPFRRSRRKRQLARSR